MRRQVKHVAALGALAGKARLTLGEDPKSTPHLVTLSAKMFERELARLRSVAPTAGTVEDRFAEAVGGMAAVAEPGLTLMDAVLRVPDFEPLRAS
jgi:hypothetical protein